MSTLVTEQALQSLKREVEGFKNKKITAEATLAEITRGVDLKQKELAEQGINSETDLEIMKNDIEARYNKINEDMNKYRQNYNN